jgi:accessory gene regulator B
VGVTVTGLSRAIAEKIGNKLGFDEERKSVLAYGAFGIMQVSFSIMLIILAGVIFDVLLEAMIISFTAVILRKYCGGAHSSSPTGCIVIGTVVTTLLAVAVNRLLPMTGTYFMTAYAAACMIFSIAAIHTYAPVDNPNKPIRNEERRKRLKKGGIVLALIISSASIILLALNIFLDSIIKWARPVSLAVCTGMAWQSFTLLKSGSWLISRLDAFVSIPIKLLGGERK